MGLVSRCSPVVVVVLALGACAPDDDVTAPKDAHLVWVPDAPAPDAGVPDASVPDVGAVELPSVPDVPDVLTTDTSPPNSPPTLTPLGTVTVKMGHSTTIDRAAKVADAEDADAALTFEWSVAHVGLTIEPGPVLRIVGPTDWSGDELVTVTVRDSGALTTARDLVVTVTLVEPPKPVETCGVVAFAFDAQKATVTEVLLSGSFNGWGSNATTATQMADPDHDGVFTASLKLTPGTTYQYKYIVDGTWKVDPKNPTQADDGFGGKNSVLVVPTCP